MATEKQISYLKSLLYKNGYETRWMSSEYRDLGAKMRERSGSIEDWLKPKSNAEISELIEKLKIEKKQ